MNRSKAKHLIACILVCIVSTENSQSTDTHDEKLATIISIFEKAPPKDASQFLDQIDRLYTTIPQRLGSGKAPEGHLVELMNKALEHLLKTFVTNKDAQTSETAMALSKLLIRYDSQLRTAIMPDYSWISVQMNVPPPEGSGIPAGGAPEAIKDPEKRALYEAAIAANMANVEINNLQQILPEKIRDSRRLLEKLLSFSEENSQILGTKTSDNLKLYLKEN